MPNWFKKQMVAAFYAKNKSQIKMLNQCWFFYKERRISK
ncbi:cortex morphogenetic protein CmpA [Paraliobacillus ryukyuensis]|nr:cortex morphogenetic protein CmpA [Paraliobacillus ryukyuensis]